MANRDIPTENVWMVETRTNKSEGVIGAFYIETLPVSNTTTGSYFQLLFKNGFWIILFRNRFWGSE